jgi:GDPmannose 4,6-dehydratase
MKRALILGIGGQDGSYLADILVEKGYKVHGLYRHTSVDNLWRVRHLIEGDQIILHRGDMLDPSSLCRVIDESDPNEIYNEADQDHIEWSSSLPSYSFQVTTCAVANLLEIVRIHGRFTKVFQPVSASMFGYPWECPQTEATPLAHYRQAYGMFICTAILYTHDSPRRSRDYLLQRICSSALKIARGEQKKLELYGLDHYVDIGYARDYMEAAHQMMQIPVSDDYVIGTGTVTQVRDIVEEAFKYIGIEDWERCVTVSNGPIKQPYYLCNPEKARRTFGFAPRTTLLELIRMLMGCKECDK